MPKGMMKTATSEMNKMMGKNVDSNNGSSEFGSTILSVAKYPELADVDVGSRISGTWQGTVSKMEDGNVEVIYSEMELDTENHADKELKRMTGAGRAAIDSGGMMEDEE